MSTSKNPIGAFQLPSNLPSLGGAASLLALADLSTAATRTALAGAPSWLDALTICPGFHRVSQTAARLHNAEYPAVAALTTGYVFRVENSVTVFFLQRMGRSGALTNLIVSPLGTLHERRITDIKSSQPSHIVLPALTILTIAHHIATSDATAILVLLLFIVSRLLTTLVLHNRCRDANWHGASEPGVQGDLLVLLSQDRWIRIRGYVDDLKAVTSGQWLRESTFLESGAESAAIIMAYVAAGLSLGMKEHSKWVLIGLQVVTAVVLGMENASTRALKMHGRTLSRDIREGRGVKIYKRRLELVEELLKEEDRVDAAMRRGLVAMGMMPPGAFAEFESPVMKQPRNPTSVDAEGSGAVTM